MKVHVNPHCVHNDMATADARALWIKGDHAAALKAVRSVLANGDYRQSEDRDLRMHEAVLAARQGETSLDQALAVLDERRTFVAANGKPELAMEATIIGIELAENLAEYETAADWMAEFLMRHGNIPLAIAHVWLMQARRATVHAGPKAGLPYFEQALQALHEEGRPCTIEVFARHAAVAMLPAGQRNRIRGLLRIADIRVREDDGTGDGYTLDELVINSFV